MTFPIRPLDLKLKLALHVGGVAALCFVLASAYAVTDSDHAARLKAERTASLVARDLELQQSQLHWVKVAGSPSPDLDAIAPLLLAPGLCIAYRTTEGEIRERACSGRAPDEDAAPAWFAALYGAIFRPAAEIARPVALNNRILGEAVVALDRQSLIAQSYRETSRLSSVMAVTLLALCLLVYAALARALRPTHVIKQGLERLAAGDLATRLPRFDLAELSALRDVFNTLAETLQLTLAERNALTARLIEVQDEERRHLARELHDEFGQCLAAVGAIAAAAEQTAASDCPALLPECRSISRIAAEMMAMLRGTLIRLRPPDVEDFGLTASLESLIAGWNSRGKGKTRFTIDVDSGVDALPFGFGVQLYRIAQEAITNAAKHAEARHIRLALAVQKGGAPEIALTVEDDGKAQTDRLVEKPGMGILGMRERIAALGGELRFAAREPHGLILEAVIAAPADAGPHG